MVFYKVNKNKLKRFEFKTNELKFGWVGLKAVNSGFLSKKHIEAARQAITKRIKNWGKLWIRVSLNYSITAKPTGAWMGKGKGEILDTSAWIYGGWVLFEISGINLNTSILALKIGSFKLPLKTKIFF